MKFKDTPEYQECILAFDLVVGLKHCRAFEKAGRMSPDTPCYRSNESTSIKAPVNIVENYGELLNQLDSNGFFYSRDTRRTLLCLQRDHHLLRFAFAFKDAPFRGVQLCKTTRVSYSRPGRGTLP